MMLTTALDQAYPFTATAKSVVGFDSLNEAAIGRKVSSNAAFLLSQCARSLWAVWAGSREARRCASPVCQPVQFRPPRLASGGGSLNELEYIS